MEGSLKVSGRNPLCYGSSEEVNEMETRVVASHAMVSRLASTAVVVPVR